MKKIKLILALLLPLSVLSQNTECILKTGISANIYATHNLNYVPQLSFTYRFLSLQTGPVFGRSDIWLGSENKEVRYKGGMLSLRIYPNKESRFFNFFLLYDFSHTFADRENYLITPNPYVWEKYVRYIDHNFGYGFRFHAVKGLYLTSHVSLGVMYRTRTLYNDKTEKYRGVAFHALAGIGYDFSVRIKGKQ
jgi:hypothetical protein